MENNKETVAELLSSLLIRIIYCVIAWNVVFGIAEFSGVLAVIVALMAFALAGAFGWID